ncbi:hypothetical protein D3C86_1419450 [compost metagenome]
MQFAGIDGAVHAAWHQAHAGGVGYFLAGQRQGHHGAAVVAAGEGDHPGATGGGTGDLHRVFHGFGTGGDQQGLLGEVARHPGVDLLAQLDVGLVGQHLEAGVAEFAQLLLHRGDDFRVQVAGVEHRDAAGEVDELAALDVGDRGVLRPVGEDRMDLADAARDGGAAALHQGFVGFAHGVLGVGGAGPPRPCAPDQRFMVRTAHPTERFRSPDRGI